MSRPWRARPLTLLGFALLALAAEPLCAQTASEILPDTLRGSFVAAGAPAGVYEQQEARGGTLLLRWPGLLEGDGATLAISFERAGAVGQFRQASGSSGGPDLSWARLAGGVLSSYRLRRDLRGGFSLEVVHRQAVPEGLQVRWTLIRDGEIAGSGESLAIRSGAAG